MKNRIGEKWITNEGYTVVIIECFGNKNVTIQFENGVIVNNIQYIQIKKGNMKNPYHKSVWGVGYCGIEKYSHRTHPKIHQTWTDMFRRCYDLKFQERNPTYKGCYVSKEWHNFQNFAKWFEENYKENFHLDKDILIKGNKIYSPETCCFVPKEINTSLIKCDFSRGKYPIGVNKVGNKFRAKLNVNGKRTHLGYFDTHKEAFEAYKTTKEVCIKEIAEKWKEEITKPTYEALINYKVEIDD